MIKRYSLSDYSLISHESDEEFNIIVGALKNVQSMIDNGIIKVGCNRDVNSKNSLKIIDTFNNELWTQGIIGAFKTIVTIENENLEITKHRVQIVIKSRFDDHDTKPYFLAKMLEMSNLQVGSEITSCSYDDLFDFLLVSLYKSKLIQAFQNGYYKQYVTHKESSLKPKGRIDINKYIKYVGLNNGNIPFVYSERTIDNPINQLTLAAYFTLKRAFPSHVDRLIDSTDTKKVIDYLVHETSFFSNDIQSIIKASGRRISHPLHTDYEDLRELSLKIIKLEGLSPFDNDGEDTDAILYYIPDLWEEYLESRLFKFLFSSELKVQSQYELKVVNHLKIRPDFIIFKNSDGLPFAVLDAKFKPKWGKGEFDLDDYTKCIRDMNAFGVHITGVVFPSKNTTGDLVSKDIISDYNSQDVFIRLKVLLPTVENHSYQSYSRILDKNIEAAGQKLNEELLERF